MEANRYGQLAPGWVTPALTSQTLSTAMSFLVITNRPRLQVQLCFPSGRISLIRFMPLDLYLYGLRKSDGVFIIITYSSHIPCT